MSAPLVDLDREIGASVDVVWPLISTAHGLTRWMATTAEIDLRPGGRVRWEHDNGWIVAGEVIEVVPFRRLVITYGWEVGELPVPPGSTTVTISLRGLGDRTVVSVRHEGLDEVLAHRHTEGWTHFIGELAREATT